MEKHTLTFVGRYTTKKDGTPLVSSTGKPYTSLRIKTNAHGDQYLSGFDNAATKNWKVGDEVEIEVEQKGEYLNFSTPKSNGGGMSEGDKALLQQIKTETTAIREELVMVRQLLQKGGVIPSANNSPLGVPYPESHKGPQPFSDEDFAPPVDAYVEDPLEGVNPFGNS